MPGRREAHLRPFGRPRGARRAALRIRSDRAASDKARAGGARPARLFRDASNQPRGLHRLRAAAGLPHQAADTGPLSRSDGGGRGSVRARGGRPRLPVRHGGRLLFQGRVVRAARRKVRRHLVAPQGPRMPARPPPRGEAQIVAANPQDGAACPLGARRAALPRRLRARSTLCQPTVAEDDTGLIQIQGGWHPLLAAAGGAPRRRTRRRPSSQTTARLAPPPSG